LTEIIVFFYCQNPSTDASVNQSIIGEQPAARDVMDGIVFQSIIF